MDAVERLSLEQTSEPTLLALTHVHRYELAAGVCAGKRVLDLCCGSGYGSRILAGSAATVVGVDKDQATIDGARSAFADTPGLSFECGDAHEYLDRRLADRFDAIVLLEGLEHLPDPARALEQLQVHAAAGITLIVSLPNSRTFGEENPHHVTDYDFDSAMTAIERFANPTVLYQFHAEGSLIRSDEAGELDGRSSLEERGDPEHCNHFIVLVNADPGAGLASSRMQLAVAPAFNSYMLELERFNRQLWRTNQRLARERLGVADSAAATSLAPRPRTLPGALQAVGAAGSRLAKGIAAVILNVLPHGLTMIVLGIRARQKEDRQP